jgi:hypothetical protein
LKVVKKTDGNEKLKKCWVISLPNERDNFGTQYFKVVRVSDFGARCVSLKSVTNWEFEDREDERVFTEKLKSVYISSKAEVAVNGVHLNNLDKIALKNK